MNKKLVFIIFLLVAFLCGVVVFSKNSSKSFLLSTKTYPFTVVLEDKSSEHIQIYKGKWVNTGGSASDASGHLQVIQNGKRVDYPMVAEKTTDSTGSVTFSLPQGEYFVYIPNPLYDDDIPHEFSIPKDFQVIIPDDRH